MAFCEGILRCTQPICRSLVSPLLGKTGITAKTDKLCPFALPEQAGVELLRSLKADHGPSW